VSRYVGPEKSGLHPFVAGDPDAIDVEVALTRKAETEIDGADGTAESGSRSNRIDAAVLAKRDGASWVVFCEAKHFDNPALRARSGRPAVLKQITAYREAIEEHRPLLEERYRNVCAALVRIDDLHHRVRSEEGLTSTGATGRENVRRAALAGVRIDPEPRLVIFGFDNAQKKDDLWQEQHLAALKRSLGSGLSAVGKPTAKSRLPRTPVTRYAAE
jgi:hypothetical protein